MLSEHNHPNLRPESPRENKSKMIRSIVSPQNVKKPTIDAETRRQQNSFFAFIGPPGSKATNPYLRHMGSEYKAMTTKDRAPSESSQQLSFIELREDFDGQDRSFVI